MSSRSAPRHASTRNSKNLAHIRQAQMTGVRTDSDVFTSLRATQIVASKPVLPAELLVMILDYLPVPSLLRFARVSRRTNEMVYDDTRWIQKLKTLGVWNEAEARQRIEQAVKRKLDQEHAYQTEQMNGIDKTPRSSNGVAGGGTRGHSGSVTMFDAGFEELRYRKSLEHQQKTPQSKRRDTFKDGFDELAISPSAGSLIRSFDPHAALTVLARVRSVRGHARQEFGKVYRALGPLYDDLAQRKGHSDALIFRTYRDPEQQAQCLSSLKRFSMCDGSLGWRERENRLDGMIDVFEDAVLREFRQGYLDRDVEGRMQRYAHVLVALNGGASAVDAFIQSNPILNHATRIGDPLECLEAVAPGHVDLNPCRAFFGKLAELMVEQADIVDKVFPPSVDVLTPFFLRLSGDIIAPYITMLVEAAHEKDVESYVKAVAGTFEHCLRLLASLKPTQGSIPDFKGQAKKAITQYFERHVESYLTNEFAVFNAKSQAEVGHWEKQLSDQEASSESFFMSNLNRQAAKRDFLSSFKKVVMMPVNTLSAPFATAKPIASKPIDNFESVDTSYNPTARSSASFAQLRPGTPQLEAPTTELAAKAAIMNSRLEGIKSLFSIEVALNLTHLAKACIERAVLMVQIGNTHGEAAKEQCKAIFVSMLTILGDRHIKNGFDKAVGHLTTYNPRQVRELRAQTDGKIHGAQTAGVEPLVTFLELVNVGDLIQQMIDVFYGQELVATGLTERDDFLDPAIKGKKHFEQMLDERVAAGLNKGIDVLMDEVEYVCATTQTTTDFNPAAASDKAGTFGVMDIGPSQTAQQVVGMIEGHTSMLTGTTDKPMLDVFTQEIGLRLFAVLCKHFKRQRISVNGAIKLICDINHYSNFVATLKQKPLSPYYQALRELSQLYLVHIDPPATYFGANSIGQRASIISGKGSTSAAQAKELATIIADSQRYHGVFPTEEVYEFAQRRADWYLVKGDVERAMYGVGCSVM